MSDINVELQEDLNITQNSDEINVELSSDLNIETASDTLNITTEDAQPVNITLQEILLRETETGASTFLELTDTPSAYTGQANKVAKVNATEDAIEFGEASGGGAWGEITGTLSNQTDLQSALDDKASTISVTDHTENTLNPHSVTAEQVGLGNVDNTADIDKPISTAAQAALDAKVDDSELADHIVNDDHTQYHTDARGDALYLRQDQNLADLSDWAAAISELKLDSIANGQGASLIGIEDVAGKYTATTVEGALAEGTTESENDGRYIRRANDDGSLTPGYEKSSSVDGITADYISDKTLHNVALKGHPATKQTGSFWIDTTVTPNVLHIYHDDDEKVIMTDFTMENDELEHLPDEFEIDVWSGNSNQLGANGLPLIQEYQTSMGAYPVPLLIDGGGF